MHFPATTRIIHVEKMNNNFLRLIMVRLVKTVGVTCIAITTPLR
jgi:hypothetical protein